MFHVFLVTVLFRFGECTVSSTLDFVSYFGPDSIIRVG